MLDKHKKLLALIGSILLIGLFLFYNVNWQNAAYLLNRRLFRILAMIMVAVAIVISTSIFQTIANNKILTPDLLGYSQLYVLIQTFLVFVFGSLHISIVNPQINFLLVTTLMVIFSLILYSFILNKSKSNLYLLLLIGTILNTLFRSIASFMQMVIDPNEFSILQNNLIASFNNVNTEIIVIAVVLLLIPIPWVLKNLDKYDVLLLGEDYASNLGINTKQMYTLSLITTSILVSVSTALVGPIVFVGILTTNLARMSLKSFKHKDLIILGILIGIIMIVGGVFIVDKVFNFTVTLSVLLNLVGGIYMIYLIMKEKVQ